MLQRAWSVAAPAWGAMTAIIERATNEAANLRAMLLLAFSYVSGDVLVRKSSELRRSGPNRPRAQRPEHATGRWAPVKPGCRRFRRVSRPRWARSDQATRRTVSGKVRPAI